MDYTKRRFAGCGWECTIAVLRCYPRERLGDVDSSTISYNSMRIDSNPKTKWFFKESGGPCPWGPSHRPGRGQCQQPQMICGARPRPGTGWVAYCRGRVRAETETAPPSASLLPSPAHSSCHLAATASQMKPSLGCHLSTCRGLWMLFQESQKLALRFVKF